MFNEQFGNLSGMKVVVTASGVAAPLAAQIFAENGAQVVYIENPKVLDVARTWPYAWATERKNMKLMLLDNALPEAGPVFTSLIQWADVYLEGMKAGTLDKWGWSDEALWKVNPKLVITHVTGFGQSGDPNYVRRAAYDFIGQSFGGIVQFNGQPDEPAYLRPYSCDYSTGLMATWSTLAAYINALKTGKGESVDVTLYETELRLQWHFSAQGFNDGIEPQRVADMDPYIAGDNFYRTKDGKYLTVSMIGIGPLTRGLGIIGLGDDPDFAGVQIVMKSDSKIADKFVQAIRDYCIEHTAAEAEKIFNDAQVPCVSLMTYADMLENSHYQARKDIIEIYSPIHGKEIKSVAPVPKFKNNPQKVVSGGDLPGVHTNKILKEIVGLDDAEIKRLSDLGVVTKK